jgi:6-phospho-3-hexuloisomerase
LRPYVQAYKELLNNISKALQDLKESQVDDMLKVILITRKKNAKVLVVGAGRSGLVGKAFAMRLMHLGFNTYVLGETITPNVGSGDLVIIISGSGKTTMPLTAARMAKQLGAKVLGVTSQKDSPLGRIVDIRVDLPGREDLMVENEYHSRQLRGEHVSLSPMGTVFEDTCMVYLDSIIVELMYKLGLSEDSLRIRHATIE